MSKQQFPVKITLSDKSLRLNLRVKQYNQTFNRV
jgi:hypothetical protein